MIAHPWPGNVRELKQRVESASAMSEGDTITALDLGLFGGLSRGLNTGEAHQEPAVFNDYFGLPLTEARDRLVEDFERAAIEKALTESDGNVSAAARKLGIHRQSLQQKISKLGVRI